MYNLQFFYKWEQSEESWTRQPRVSLYGVSALPKPDTWYILLYVNTVNNAAAAPSTVFDGH